MEEQTTQKRIDGIGRGLLNLLDKNNPLWLPKGSVRAILAILSLLMANNMIESSGEVPDWLVAVISAIVTFYFTGRAMNGSKKE